MSGPAAPGRFLEVHFPPDADIFAGLEPLADVRDLARLVEVERDSAVGARDRGFADQHRTPRRRERPGDRKSVVWGKSVSVRVVLGGRCITKKYILILLTISQQ